MLKFKREVRMKISFQDRILLELHDKLGAAAWNMRRMQVKIMGRVIRKYPLEDGSYSLPKLDRNTGEIIYTDVWVSEKS